MNQQRWEEIGRLYLEVLELLPEKRPAYLDEACRHDATLRKEVISLLAVDEDGGDSIVDQILETQDSVGYKQIGDYQVLDQLGQGGTSTVYLAEPITQPGFFVAVKVLQIGLQSTLSQQRFSAERAILEHLHHPQIAQFIDGGETEDGKPFIVMEYVDGIPITTYCDQNQLTIKDRVELFNQVCAAVHFAHQNLVVHRDLKPSHVLITEAGEVKLLDFGIAKLLSPEEWALDSIPRTRTLHRVLTPAYASPEQIRGTLVTTASDVYSLGVMLYELLTGHRPYLIEHKSVWMIEKIIAEQEPEKLSVVIGQTQKITVHHGETITIQPADITQNRKSNLQGLRQALRGDLERITFKTLRKEPHRRYESAGALASDLNRFLKGLPVEARSDQLGYLVKKFVRRNPVGVGASIIALIALLIGSTVALIQANRAIHEAEVAFQVASYLEGLFEATDPYNLDGLEGDTLRAITVLELGRQQMDHSLNEQPEVKARLQIVLARVYSNLGKYHLADSLAHNATLLLTESMSQSMARAEALLARGRAKYYLSHFEEAQEFLESSLSIREKLDRNEDDGYAQTQFWLAWTLHRMARYDEAHHLATASVGLFQSLYEYHVDIASGLHQVGVIEKDRGKYEEAEQYLYESLVMYREVLEPDHLFLAKPMNDLGMLFFDTARYEEADRMISEAVRIRQKHFNVHFDISVSLNDLGITKMRLGAYKEAEESIREALEINRALFGDDHAEVTTNLYNLALLHYQKQNYEQALTGFKDVLERDLTQLGESHPVIAINRSRLGWVCYRLKQVDQAEAEFLQAMRIFGDEDNTTRFTPLPVVGLGRIRMDEGRLMEADSLFLKGIDLYKQILPDDDWRIAQARSYYAASRMASGHYEEAGLLLRKAIPVLQRSLREFDPTTIEARAWLKTVEEHIQEKS